MARGCDFCAWSSRGSVLVSCVLAPAARPDAPNSDARATDPNGTLAAEPVKWAVLIGKEPVYHNLSASVPVKSIHGSASETHSDNVLRPLGVSGHGGLEEVLIYEAGTQESLGILDLKVDVRAICTVQG
jgi:hypothetical protein